MVISKESRQTFIMKTIISHKTIIIVSKCLNDVFQILFNTCYTGSIFNLLREKQFRLEKNMYY